MGQSEVIDAVVVGAGQSGLAASAELRRRRIDHVVLEHSASGGGSWPHYYDSLTLFSPARFSALQGATFAKSPNRYPARDDVVEYLRNFGVRMGLPVRFDHRVDSITRDGIADFVVRFDGREPIRARRLIMATGGFATPYRPRLVGADLFRGRMLHAADYRRPDDFVGERVLVVGGGNTAVQIASELARVADTTLVTRHDVVFQRKRYLGVDFHYILRWGGIDRIPTRAAMTHARKVVDDGRYQRELIEHRPDRRPMFTHLTAVGVEWHDGTSEPVDTIILATGYRPNLHCLEGLGALDVHGAPLHRRGVSTRIAGLGFVGLPGQRNMASATLRGASPDAKHVIRALWRAPLIEHENSAP